MLDYMQPIGSGNVMSPRLRSRLVAGDARLGRGLFDRVDERLLSLPARRQIPSAPLVQSAHAAAAAMCAKTPIVETASGT